MVYIFIFDTLSCDCGECITEDAQMSSALRAAVGQYTAKRQ